MLYVNCISMMLGEKKYCNNISMLKKIDPKETPTLMCGLGPDLAKG